MVATACAVLFLSLNEWFGAGDLPAMLAWSLPRGGIVAVLAGRTLRRTSTKSRVVETSALAAVGILAGVGWTFAAAAILGGWIGAFSFPVLYCWGIGGLAGGLAAARFRLRELAPVPSPPAT